MRRGLEGVMRWDQEGGALYLGHAQNHERAPQ